MDSDRRQRLEERIARLGRERVFDYVASLGWGRDMTLDVLEEACRALEQAEK